ncbi:Nucleotidyltransferase domain family protein [Leishmania donovani]|uniref:Nucleotidyltransferase domain family protein n=1 Tax=Leishmania donovani TaxID=5661 RepID=A0A504XXI5_LEIDO|nr:Nucleotidyltransferase domain family protein [Leishmania donovani]
MAKPPPIPYYDFITVLPTFVATCLTLKPEDEANREQLCWIIEAVLRKHLNQNAEIRVHGSITTGLALPSSDVDLLAVGYQPIAPLEALQRLSKALLELDEDSKNDALRLQELIEAEAQHRRRQLMEEAKKRAKQVALAAATGAGVAVAPDEGRHWARESRCSASEVCEAASLRDSDSDADDDDIGRRSEENASEGEGTSGLSPKRVARAGSIVKSLLLSSTEAAEEMPVIGEMDEAARAAPNRRVSSHSRRSPCVPQDGTATTAPQRSVSASSLSTESSTTCFSATAFPLDTRKVFLTSSATVGDDGEFVRLASGSGTVPGAGATSTCAKSAVGHADSVSASRLHDPDVATADTEVYGTVGDVEQAEEVFRGQIEKDYNFSTSVDLSALFAPSMGGGMPPVAPPVAAASGLSIGGASSSSSGLAFQTTTTRLHDSASLSSPRESAAASGSADLKGSVRSLPPAMASGLHVDEDNIAAHAQPLPRSKAAPADADKLANEAELRSSQARLADGGAAEPEGRTVSGGGDATAAEAEAAHAGTETVAADEAAAAQSSSVSPTAAASGERAATVQTAAAPPASQDAVTRSPIVLGATDGRGRGAGHLTYVPVHEGPLFFVQSITATRVPVIKLTDKATGTKVDITFAGGEHWRSMQLTRSLLEVFPHARTLILFLKYCVRSLGAGESEPGGVTSFAIYLMVLHFYNECRQRILLLLRERNAASSSAQAQSRQAGADTGEHQQPQKDRAAEEALRRGGAADNSATSPTAGPAPLTLGLLEYMLGEYLARVEQRHAQLVEETGARRSVSLDAAGSDDVAELYSSSGNIQKAAPALGRASSSTAVATGACATIKAAYASDDKERLRAIRQTILGFVGDPAAATTAAGASVTAAVALALAPQTTTGATPEKEGGAGRTQQTRPTSSDAAETAVVDAAPGRLAPPPHHYLLKTVEPQPHERVVGEGSHVDTPGAYEVAGRDEKVAEDTSAEHSTAAMATPEALHQETRADAAAAAVAEGTETPEELVSAAAGSAANVDPVKAGRGSAHDADSEDSAFDAFAADFLRRQAEVSDLFLDFCHYYGCAFDYETSGIRFTIDGRSEVVAKPFLCSRRGQHFHMTSPFDPEYDLTARMTHMRDFQWLCWWFAEWGAARQSPQYYGSCSLQYVLQCLSPMSADADCQAVHQALMKQAQPQQHAGGVPVPPMNVYNGPSVEQQRCGGAGVAQHSVAAPFPHLQSTMIAPHLKYGGSISIASTAAKKGSATAHETAAIRAASSGSRSRPASECGATAAAAVSARTRARRRPPLQLPYVDSREEAFEGSSSHAAMTPTAAGMMAVHSYPTENNDDVDGGNSPRGRVDVMLTPVKGDEDEEDEAGGRYGDRGYGSESVVDYTDCLDQCGGRGDANAVMPQHYPQQLAPHDAQATAEGNAGVGEHGAGGLCNGYSPNMAYAGNQGYAASQQQQVSYGTLYYDLQQHLWQQQQQYHTTRNSSGFMPQQHQQPDMVAMPSMMTYQSAAAVATGSPVNTSSDDAGVPPLSSVIRVSADSGMAYCSSASNDSKRSPSNAVLLKESRRGARDGSGAGVWGLKLVELLARPAKCGAHIEIMLQPRPKHVVARSGYTATRQDK